VRIAGRYRTFPSSPNDVTDPLPSIVGLGNPPIEDNEISFGSVEGHEALCGSRVTRGSRKENRVNRFHPRGVLWCGAFPTGASAAPLKSHLLQDPNRPRPSAEGKVRGVSLASLYKGHPQPRCETQSSTASWPYAIRLSAGEPASETLALELLGKEINA
jgi:hypothetical protein